jgi:hypothetical protein
MYPTREQAVALGQETVRRAGGADEAGGRAHGQARVTQEAGYGRGLRNANARTAGRPAVDL